MSRVLPALALSLFLIAHVWAEDPVHFPDPNMKTAVENALWIYDPTPSDMLQLTSLSARNWGISDLTGLGHATNLEYLNLRHNQISDVSVLCGLSRLETIILDNNQIMDVSPLSCLDRLDFLDVHDNPISDVAPLSAITSLTSLSLRSTGRSDISALSSLINLRTLILRHNVVTDVSPLAGLTNLETLDVCLNKVSDLGPLSGLTNLTTLDLGVNDIVDVSPLSGLTNLRTLYLYSNKIVDITGLLGLSSLRILDLEDNRELGAEAYCRDLHAMYRASLQLEYSPNPDPPTGLRATDAIYDDKVKVSWDDVCNGPLYTTYYLVSRAPSNGGDRVPVSEWQASSRFDDTTAEPGVQYDYWVQTAITSEGLNSSIYSQPETGARRQTYRLVLSSTPGGSVASPGEGTYTYSDERTVSLQAESVDADLFFFEGWTGTAVDAGKLSDISDPLATVTVDAPYTLTAHFLSRLSTLYVDDDAPNDPGSGDAAVSDPDESGTVQHPFDRIQEAIEVADRNATIRISPGTYRENIDLLGKSLYLMGFDPEDPNVTAYPVIDGGDSGPVLQCTQNEDPNCLVMGLVITRARPQAAPAVLCSQSSPSLVNCLIVANRIPDPNLAAVVCIDSHAILVSCTIADNHATGLAVRNSDIVLTQSILWGNMPEQVCLEGDSQPSITYSDIAGGWPDVGNIDADPMFVQRSSWADPNDLQAVIGADDPGTVRILGDYHLQSQAGRWDPQIGGWVADEATSPCIDVGDPSSPLGYEPAPNGGVINIGAYGGTVQAAKSRVDN